MPASTDLRAAIADAVQAVAGLGLVAFGYVPGGGMGYPVAFLEQTGDEQVGQSWTWTEIEYKLFVLYGSASERDVQELMDKSTTGASSISTALRADPTFGGKAIDTAISGQTRAIYQDSAGYKSFGREWTIKALVAS